MSSMHIASVPKRIGAGVVDLLLLTGLFILLANVLGEAESGDGGASASLDGLPALLFFLAAFAYYGVTELVWGRTLGKRLLGLRVVGDDGSRLRPRQAALRTVLRIVDGLLFYAVAIACIVATGERRQRIGDLAAGTHVVEG